MYINRGIFSVAAEYSTLLSHFIQAITKLKSQYTQQEMLLTTDTGASMNRTYGFEGEAKHKHGEQSYKLFAHVFTASSVKLCFRMQFLF